jgi:hypothetical protein
LPNVIQLKRGLKASLPASAAAGEPVLATDTSELNFGTGAGIGPQKIAWANVIGGGALATPATTGAQTVLMATAAVFTITPTGACTFNASGGVAGKDVTFIVTTSGTSAFVLTFGTNFKAAGTLSTGTVTAKVFCISFICKDGTLWVETGRTAAM